MGDSLQDLINNVVQWGHDRNLNAPENLKAQTMKLVSEFGEIGMGLCQNDDTEVVDGIGDTLVVAIIIGEQLGLPIASHDIQKAHNPGYDGIRYENASGRLGLFVDAVLKGHTNDKVRALLGEFVGALCEFVDDWNIDLSTDPKVCLESAYTEIKDRKGIMFNGAFIKESDERYAGAMAELGRA
jgi:hypothetical protein